jgi:hypothetical protein
MYSYIEISGNINLDVMMKGFLFVRLCLSLLGNHLLFYLYIHALYSYTSIRDDYTK